MLDPENWKIVLKVTAIRQSLERGRKGIPDAITGLDLAIDGLFDHTDFNKVIRKLYRQRLDGILKTKQEEKLRKLGVRF